MGVHNFSAGPAKLPAAVMRQAREELLDWQGGGVSVMEVSHRGEAFVETAQRAESDLRALLAIPEAYAVLFLQGGASLQFAAAPLNLLGAAGRADYLDTGVWSAKAIAEARRYGKVNVAASAAATGYTAIPPRADWRLDATAAYLHYTPNETVNGVEFHAVPEAVDVPLVADMSSTLLSRPLEVGRFGMIYAGAQKNIGPAGLTVVIVRRDLLGRAAAGCPTLLDYRVAAENGSMYNTPPTFAWYLAGLVFAWLRAEGGLEVMAERNRRKAGKLYAAIDASGFYRNRVALDCRSWMNVPFELVDPGLDAAFLAEAEAEGLVGLKGHKLVGGMRASLYNAVPMAAVEALIGFMGEFERRHG